MTLQQLRYFCVTAEVLHYTRAAALLYISQPSLSYALSKLEKELGIPLFEKQGKQITLTRYGAEFLPYAKRALSELSKGQDRLKELKTPSTGIINLGYIYSVSFSVLPSFVERFYAYLGNRQTAFRFHQGMAGGLIEQLLNGSLDLLIAGRPEIDSIEYLPIAEQELFLALPASHRLANRASVTSCDGEAIMPRLPILDNFNLRLIPFSDVPMTREICLLRYRLHTMSSAVQGVWDFARHLSESGENR